VNLPRFALRRPVTVLMSLLALLVLGVLAQRGIPLQLLPSGFDPPFLWVELPTLPAAPADNERLIAEPLEDQLSTLPRLKRIRLYISGDSVGCLLELRGDAQVDEAWQQVRDRLDRLLPKLPEGARAAFIWRHNPNDQPIYVLGITLPEHLEDPHHFLEQQLARPLERLPGVSSVSINGLASKGVRIELNAGALEEAGLEISALIRKLNRENFNLAVGALEEGGRRLLLRALSRYRDLESLRELPVGAGRRLAEVAKVTYGPDPTPRVHRINGRPSATLRIFKEASANTVELGAEISAQIARTLKDQEGLISEVFFDQGSHIKESMEQLRISALYGGAFAILILFLFLRSLEMTLWVALAIPLCLIGALEVLYFQGESLNIMSMMGLMLSVGMVIDNAIVVLENIERHQRLGSPDPEERGGREVSLAITLATLTTLVVFLPMVLLQDNPALSFFLGRIGAPVGYALLASLGVALVYIPAAARLSRRRAREAVQLPRLQRLYLRALSWSLKHHRASSLLLLLSLLSILLPAQKLRRVDQLQGGVTSLRIYLNAPANGSFEELDESLSALEQALLAQRERLGIRATLARMTGPERASLKLYFKKEQPMERDELLKEIRALMPKRPGFRGRIGWRGASGEGGVLIGISGPDSEQSAELAQNLLRYLRRREFVHQVDLESAVGARELRFLVDREAAERVQLSAMQIAGSLDYALRGRRLSDLHTPAREIPVHVLLSPEDRSEREQLEQLKLKGSAGTVPLAQLTEAQIVPGQARIIREDRRGRVDLRVYGEENELFKALERSTLGFKESLPEGYRLEMGGRFKKRDENEAGGAFALLVSVCLVFFLMGLLFESLILPFSIIFSIPLAFIGVLWTLYLSNTPLDIMAIVGCIILVGVVVNNGIVLIDQVQQRRAEGLSRDEALLQSGHERLRPILMTACTTMAGLLPMAFGDSALLGIKYAPLARVIMGGLAAGTLLTLFAVPLLYSLLDELRALPARFKQGPF